MENEYHSPYDVHHRQQQHDQLDRESDQLNHYEAPSMLARNPSGSIYIPSDPLVGQTTLDSRLRFDPSSNSSSFSPHHQMTLTASSHRLTNSSNQQHKNLLSSPSRSPNSNGESKLSSGSTLPSYASQQQTRLLAGLGSSNSAGHHTSAVAASLVRRSHNSPNSSSQYSSGQTWRMKKDLSRKCSWKFAAIIFILLSVILLSALIYTTASNYMKMSYEACAIVEASQSQNTNDIEIVGGRQDSTKNDDYWSEPPKVLHESHFPQRSSLPPDGTTFAHLTLGDKQEHSIPSYSYWNFQFHQSQASYVEFTFGVPKGASIGIYARRNAIPTLTLNDIRDVLTGSRERTARSSALNPPSVATTKSYYLETGHWFLSLYNDDGQPQKVTFLARVATELTRNCPKGCSGHGECVLGQCQCETGFDGPDCGQSICPILCTGNGDYEDGQCRCYPGWKGLECQLRHDECEEADCGGHGKCVNGNCVCARGFTGKHCQQLDCPDPSCSGHGFCIEGSCVCRKGWKGKNCEHLDREARQCLPDCSGHGEFDLDTQKCVCKGHWTGKDCSKERCNLDCGPHGACESGHCFCDQGWDGKNCQNQLCDPRCESHGVCSNGTCLCTNGWNGKHCTLEGCPNHCNGHGQCKTNMDMQWECWCDSGWFGDGCQIKLETDCSDRKDNDNDGLTDCEDPECCENPVCSKSQLCHTVPHPIDILLRKNPPAITASFFEKMKFIIEEKGMQNYVQRAGFNESRAAVVRGQVVTPSGMGLIGVRVSTNLPNEGFTMTRDDGWFDLMVNGGGSVKLQFGRNPYPPLRLHVYVPWNELVVLEPVVLGKTPATSGEDLNCLDHDFRVMKPIVLATWKNKFKGQVPTDSALILESQSVQESLEIRGSDINLVYHSNRAKGYLSIIQLQLTPSDNIPDSLLKVYLKITIEGVVHEKVFEADPNIQYTYAWDRLNEYRQRVYGITKATVKVGYEYKDCKKTVWTVQTTKLNGHEITDKYMGGWQLHVQHKYNFHAAILQKGDGDTVYLKHKPKVVRTIMGNGDQRPLDCISSNNCPDGENSLTQKLLAPKSLASAPDGSIYLADYNLIRRLAPDGRVYNLLMLNSKHISYRYHMAHAVEMELRETLYIVQPDAHRIIRLKQLKGDDFNMRDNWEPFVGTGNRCLPGESDSCGDGGKAANARLAYPKGIAVTSSGIVYIADGSNIREVDRNGIINTVIGHNHHRNTWKPVPCEGAMKVEDVQLSWPTELAISPLDDTLYFIDDNVIFKMSQDGQVFIVGGRPMHCPPPSNKDLLLATSATLVEPQSLSFAPNGDLYIAESDSQRINRIRKISTNGRISLVAGKDSKCNCLDAVCPCFDADKHKATDVKFSAISSITCTPDNVVYVADQGNYRIRSISSNIPKETSEGVFEIPDPDAQELYIFNKFGQHVLTKDLMTSNILYTMTYTQGTSDGTLSSVTDQFGRKMSLVRAYKGYVSALEVSSGFKYNLKRSNVGDLEAFESLTEKSFTTFKYYGTTGLLKSKMDSSNNVYMFVYDNFGRVINTIFPTGESVYLSFNLTTSGASIEAKKDGQIIQTIQFDDNEVAYQTEEHQEKAVISIDVETTLNSKTSWSQRVKLTTIPHPVIARTEDPVMGDSFPMVAEEKTYLGSNLVNKINWDFNLATNGHLGQMMGMRKMLKVNGDNLVTAYFDKLQRREVFYSGVKNELLEIRYDSSSRPIHWEPKTGEFAPLKQSYDRFGRLQEWSWGGAVEGYEYDKLGRLIKIRQGNTTILTYNYQNDNFNRPNSIITGQRGKFSLEYDDKTFGLKRIQTPRGHFHTFTVRPAVGEMRFQYSAPWSEGTYEMRYNSEGKLQSKLMPGNLHEGVHYKYAKDNLDQIICGDFEAGLSYDHETGVLESVVIRKGHSFDMKFRNKYHSGLLKEQKIRFSGGYPNLDNALFRYQYDGHGRFSSMISSIGMAEGQQQTWGCTFDSNTGLLTSLGSLKISRMTDNKVTLEDSNSNYFKSIELDSNARVKKIIHGLKRKEIWSVEFGYDNRNKISSRTVTDYQGISREEKYSYTPDGHLDQVWGLANFDYKYDSNGNLVGVKQGQTETSLQYDAGDRVEKAANERLTYDVNGYVRQIGDHQKFWHDARGLLTEHLNMDKGMIIRTTYQYDHLKRLVAFYDSKGHVSQFFYANPSNQLELTHVHNPKSRLTQRLLYDQNGHLVAIETGEQKIFVCSDQNGSPTLVLRPDGSILKEISYSPFGQVLIDTNPSMKMPLGFQGLLNLPLQSGLLDVKTGRIYMPSLRQYLNPDWETLGHDIDSPLQLFVYRFSNNDPINQAQNINYMTETSDWMKLFGYDLDRIFDASYRTSKSINRLETLNLDTKKSGMKVLSGMETSFNHAHKSLRQLSFMKSDSSQLQRKLVLNKHLDSKPLSFGSGVLLSVIDDHAYVRVVDGVPGVIQNIFHSVLNGSYYLDVSYHPSAETSKYFFAKTSTGKFSTDKDNVNRLSGEYDVSVRDLGSPAGAKDMKIENEHLVLHVIYGPDVAKHRNDILLEQVKEASNLAWSREKSLIQSGFSGNGDWTKSQRTELVMGHRVRQFGAVEIHSRNKYPQLVRDASNYFFIADGQEQQQIRQLQSMTRRRKSRHGKARLRH